MNKEKIEYSLNLIKKAEKLALKLSDKGFYVGFSGGKDSQVVLDLIKRAGVKFEVFYNVTTIDPPENVYFIRKNYPEVIFSFPKENFYKIVERKGMPTILKRFCCAILKEINGVGRCVVTGVRAEESKKRSSYTELTLMKRKKVENESKDIDKMSELNFQCVSGKDKFILNPILHWTEKDVWQYIKENNLPINPCYKEMKRVGCVFCPFAKRKEILMFCKRYPKMKENLLKSIQKYLDKKEGEGHFSDAEDFFSWWISRKSFREYEGLRRQLELF